MNFVRYADDIIVTGKSKRILLESVLPAMERFLAERGLELSKEKTHITHIRQGFTFLGQTFRKTGNRLRITPSAEALKSVKQKCAAILQKYVSAPMAAMIKALNQTLRGWTNYHRFVVASATFNNLENYLYDRLWRMLKRRQPNKSKKWLVKRYWSAAGPRGGFSISVRNAKGQMKVYRVLRPTTVQIKRHIKIRATANPYDPADGPYFWHRRNRKASKEIGATSSRTPYRGLNVKKK